MKQITMDFETYNKEKRDIETCYISIGMTKLLRSLNEMIALIHKTGKPIDEQEIKCLFQDTPWQLEDVANIINSLMFQEKAPSQSSS